MSRVGTLVLGPAGVGKVSGFLHMSSVSVQITNIKLRVHFVIQ